jgi:hypothetical protein
LLDAIKCGEINDSSRNEPVRVQMYIDNEPERGSDVYNTNDNREHVPEPEGFKCL